MYISYANLNELVIVIVIVVIVVIVIVVIVSYFTKVNNLQMFQLEMFVIYLFALGKVSSVCM